MRYRNTRDNLSPTELLDSALGNNRDTVPAVMSQLSSPFVLSYRPRKQKALEGH